MRIYNLFFSLFSLFSVIVTLNSALALQSANCNTAMEPSTPDSNFTDHGDGTVTDNSTGLMWKKCLEGLSGTGCSGTVLTFSWATALQQPALESDTTYTDWRLPNIKELHSIIEESCHTPAINTDIFPGIPSESVVWSSSPYAGVDTQSWNIDFSSGDMDMSPTTNDRTISTYHVRLVRDVTN
ncbi:MAG: DUF1566 domain-containing protein [Candidatus Electrothrix scaldis]|nr:MAG: DUF1566 domain-containing protein [Candidatus Electrothrix sp. GW3-3]